MYIGTIALGLWFSATSCNGMLTDEYAEWPVNIWCWGLFAWYYRSGERKQRIEMLTVVAFATPMELFFSEVWLIYEYQRDLMPLFVPAGHYFLFDLGRICADKIKENWALPMLLPLVPVVFYGAWTGGDTSAVLLLVLVLVFIRMGPQPRLYAAMVLSLIHISEPTRPY